MEEVMSKMKFNADTPIYTTEEGFGAKAWRIEASQDALAAVYARGKPVVVFVHGRGKEPNKSFRGATFAKGLAVWKLELGYDCSIVMLNWDSAFPGILFKDRSRALGNTLDGSKRLCAFLAELAKFESAHPHFAKPVLVVHSMGSIVLQKAIAGGAWPAAQPLFKQVVISQPDADDAGHDTWLSALGSREKVYCTWNADDKILKKSTDARPASTQALGLGTTAALAQNVHYIDLTSMGKLGELDDDHEVFGKGAMNGQVNVCQFFEQAILGKDVILNASNVASIDRNVVRKLKQRSDPKAPCLKIPALPDFS
jgi:esterase/lipase superfamily enzyme